VAGPAEVRGSVDMGRAQSKNTMASSLGVWAIFISFSFSS